MTDQQFLDKVNELKTEVLRLIDEKAQSFVLSGAVDLDDWDDDFRLAKVFMSAMGSEIKVQFRPLTDELRAERDKILLII